MEIKHVVIYSDKAVAYDPEFNIAFANKHQAKLNQIQDIINEILDDAVKQGVPIEYALQLVDEFTFVLAWLRKNEEYRKRVLKYYGLEEGGWTK